MDGMNLKEILTYIVTNLVEHPSEISINQIDRENAVTLELKVAPSDMGKVIGRQGRIAKEIRVLLRAAGAQDNKKVEVSILD